MSGVTVCYSVAEVRGSRAPCLLNLTPSFFYFLAPSSLSLPGVAMAAPGFTKPKKQLNFCENHSGLVAKTPGFQGFDRPNRPWKKSRLIARFCRFSGTIFSSRKNHLEQVL
jgi:hypothetical protein